MSIVKNYLDAISAEHMWDYRVYRTAPPTRLHFDGGYHFFDLKSDENWPRVARILQNKTCQSIIKTLILRDETQMFEQYRCLARQQERGCGRKFYWPFDAKLESQRCSNFRLDYASYVYQTHRTELESIGEKYAPTLSNWYAGDELLVEEEQFCWEAQWEMSREIEDWVDSQQPHWYFMAYSNRSMQALEPILAFFLFPNKRIRVFRDFVCVGKTIISFRITHDCTLHWHELPHDYFVCPDFRLADPPRCFFGTPTHEQNVAITGWSDTCMRPVFEYDVFADRYSTPAWYASKFPCFLNRRLPAVLVQHIKTFLDIYDKYLIDYHPYHET